jgi:tetratricopeptide (TPR) repeat protein
MFLVLATTLAPRSPERKLGGTEAGAKLGLIAQFALMVLAMLACFAYLVFAICPTGKEQAYLKLAGQSADLDGQDELLREAARANPLGWEADYWRGRVWQAAAESGQPGSGPPAADRAIAAYQAALARQPLLREAWLGMAEVILARPGAIDDPRTLQSAGRCLEEAARLDPAGLAIAVRLADVLDREKEDEAAVHQYDWVLELDRLAPPESPRLSDKQRQDVEKRLKALKESLAAGHGKP